MGWLQKHKKELLTAAAVAAAAYTGGASLGLLGGGAAAGAAGAGAAGAGAAGAAGAEGLGLLGAGMGGGSAASMFGAAPGFASSLVGGAGAVTPAFTGGLAGADAALAGTGASGLSMFGPGIEGAGSLASLSGPGAGMEASWLDKARGLNWDKGMKALQMANSFTKQDQPQQPPPMPRAPQQVAISNDVLERLRRMYGGLYV